MINTKKLALRGGIILGGSHFIWALFIAFMPTTFQKFLNRIFDMHMMTPYRMLTQFNFMKMLLLIIVTFVCGYLLGWMVGGILNNAMKKN